ncbi:MAG: RHS repeat-associated core domain-containing protein [Phycisphaerae bacterium]|nr:RHS repeat-associated core domain-containing protein [Phycisphaerae bacterium]
MKNVSKLLMLAVLGLILSTTTADAMLDYQTGRWLSQDPLGYVDGVNSYQYTNSNPTRYIDPSGLWSLKGHEQIIDKAMEQVDCELKCGKEGLKDFQKGLRKGAVQPDKPGGKPALIWIGANVYVWGWTGLMDNIYGKTKTYKSHWGEYAWWHAMSNVGDDPVVIRNEIAAELILAAREFNSDCDDNETDCKDLGKLLGRPLHMIMDSYSPSHTQRANTEDRVIEAFLTYELQKNHSDGDDPKKNPKEFQEAVDATAKLLSAIACNDFKESELRNVILNEILALKEENGKVVTKTGVPGVKYKK